MKGYVRLVLTEAQFKTVHGAVLAQRQVMLDRWTIATSDEEKAFYAARLDNYDLLLKDQFNHRET